MHGLRPARRRRAIHEGERVKMKRRRLFSSRRFASTNGRPCSRCVCGQADGRLCESGEEEDGVVANRRRERGGRRGSEL